MNVVIEMEDIHKRFGARPVISGFDLTVRRGEVVGLQGPSGAGKSTILRMVAGLEKADAGRLHVHTRNMGYVFQEDRLLPWDTAINNVVLPLRAQGMARPEALRRARFYLNSMQLSEFEAAFPHQLSGGMRQRVSLARAFAIKPDILLLDEPFTGLDKELIKDMRQLLETALEEHPTTVIHVTHDPSELLDRTRRVISLKMPTPKQPPTRAS